MLQNKANSAVWGSYICSSFCLVCGGWGCKKNPHKSAFKNRQKIDLVTFEVTVGGGGGIRVRIWRLCLNSVGASFDEGVHVVWLCACTVRPGEIIYVTPPPFVGQNPEGILRGGGVASRKYTPLSFTHLPLLEGSSQGVG